MMQTNTVQPSREICRLIEIMAALRAPLTGCAWDREQTFSTIAPYVIEEAYEVAEAISRDDLDDLRDELGDLLLQVVFHARMAEEIGAFDFGGVVEAITAKLIRRHPHVFGQAKNLSPDAVKALWSKIKAEEKAEKALRRGEDSAQTSLLSRVSEGLPTLARALRLQAEAGKVGFDWNNPMLVLDKIHEEASEVAAALSSGNTHEIESEIGDLLFAVINLARHAKVDPDTALRGANAKFQRRFGYIEGRLAAQNKTFDEATLAEMDSLWDEAKQRGL